MNELLCVPEDHLADVIRVIRAGLDATKYAQEVNDDVRAQLTKWCDEEETYLNGD